MPYTPETIGAFSKDTKDGKTFADFGYEMFDENGIKTGEVATKNNDSYEESQLPCSNLIKSIRTS